MGNAFFTTKAAEGMDGFSPAYLATLQTNAATAADNAAFLAEAGESITYTPVADDGTVGTPLTFLAVVDRHPPASITEDGKALSDDVELTFMNDAAGGVTSINVGRDTITVSSRYGGPTSAKLVTAILKGDVGLWMVRVR